MGDLAPWGPLLCLPPSPSGGSPLPRGLAVFPSSPSELVGGRFVCRDSLSDPSYPRAHRE